MLLFDWRIVRVGMEPMYYYVWVDSSYVFVRPSEAIVVLSEEFNECEPELYTEACPNLDFVVRIVRVDADIVEFI